MAGYSSKVHSDGKTRYYFHRAQPPPSPTNTRARAPFSAMERARTHTHTQAPHTRAEFPSGSFCMNYRLLMRGYETPSAQEAARHRIIRAD